MSPESAGRQLIADQECAGVIRSTLDQIGCDLALQSLRSDSFTSPFADREALAPALPRLNSRLEIAIRLLSLTESLPVAIVEDTLGSDFLHSGLGAGLLVLDSEQDSISTQGYAVASRLGQYFVVSASRLHPGFDLNAAEVYFGQDSLNLAHHLHRRSGVVASTGNALDLCTGSGIAGQSLAAIRRGLLWTAIDLSPQSVEVAQFNAMLNGLEAQFLPVAGDLYEPVAGRRFSFITANPPFIPVPDGVAFPNYGNGGNDGLSVLRPLIDGLADHLLPSGRAIIYAEALSDSNGPIVLPLLEKASERGLSLGVTIFDSMPIERALYTLGLTLSTQEPSRLEDLTQFKQMFNELGAVRYEKFFIEGRHGPAGVVVNSIAK